MIFQVFYKYDGNPHHIPGVPPMYDYDFFPQEVHLPVRYHFQRDSKDYPG
jgi:hypothetical protein